MTVQIIGYLEGDSKDNSIINLRQHYIQEKALNGNYKMYEKRSEGHKAERLNEDSSPTSIFTPLLTSTALGSVEEKSYATPRVGSRRRRW